MPPLQRRPRRYVPRHSTREPLRPWDGRRVVDLTTTDASPTDVLRDVLDALGGLDAAEDRRDAPV
ncbi:hypothetical protein [Kineococcus sp. SYSU DK001]|uniref:hypothetical protein n=1 Tax=Kineococcus sp. SYSU DK001 TaxID=3383122 RepID=UPI003D7EC1CF